MKSPAAPVQVDTQQGGSEIFLVASGGQVITARDVDLDKDISQLLDAWLAWEKGTNDPGASKSEEGCNVGTRIEDGEVDARLAFGSADLVAGKPLRGYGLRGGSTVQILGRLRGGAQLGKAVKGRSQVKKKGTEKPKDQAELQAKNAKMQEIDLARQQATAAKAELRRRIEQEEKNSKMNRLKIQNQWRKIMRLAKVESLRKDIEILSQNHERDVDRKDAIIQMLDRDLEEAEDQFQTALMAHLQKIDSLIDLQDSRLLALEQAFEVEMKTLQEEFADERKQLEGRHATVVQELRDIIAAVEAQEEEREADAQQEHEQQREEIRNKNLEEINVLRITLDTQIEDLEQHFETAHINYLQNTDQRTTDFKYLTSKDQELSREIEIKIRKIERLQSSLQHWRTKISQNVKENAERNSFLTEERNTIQGHFQHLKGRMHKFREAQAKRLCELTQNANAVKTKLRKQLKLAEKILKLAELTRKAETEQEKVQPFYVSAHTNGVEGEAENTVDTDRELAEKRPRSRGARGGEPDDHPSPFQSSSWDEMTGQPVQRWDQLDNFYKRYNKALLDKLAIEREQEGLEAENRGLKNIIKQYLDGISVTRDVLAEPNPLLVVNGRVNLASGAVDSLPASRRIATIEANHMVGTGRVSVRTGL